MTFSRTRPTVEGRGATMKTMVGQRVERWQQMIPTTRHPRRANTEAVVVCQSTAVGEPQTSCNSTILTSNLAMAAVRLRTGMQQQKAPLLLVLLLLLLALLRPRRLKGPRGMQAGAHTDFAILRVKACWAEREAPRATVRNRS